MALALSSSVSRANSECCSEFDDYDCHGCYAYSYANVVFPPNEYHLVPDGYPYNSSCTLSHIAQVNGKTHWVYWWRLYAIYASGYPTVTVWDPPVYSKLLTPQDPMSSKGERGSGGVDLSSWGHTNARCVAENTTELYNWLDVYACHTHWITVN